MQYPVVEVPLRDSTSWFGDLAGYGLLSFVRYVCERRCYDSRMKDSSTVRDRNAPRRGQSYALSSQEMQIRMCVREGSCVHVPSRMCTSIRDIKDGIKAPDTWMKKPDMKYKSLFPSFLLLSIYCILEYRTYIGIWLKSRMLTLTNIINFNRRIDVRYNSLVFFFYPSSKFCTICQYQRFFIILYFIYIESA